MKHSGDAEQHLVKFLEDTQQNITHLRTHIIDTNVDHMLKKKFCIRLKNCFNALFNNTVVECMHTHMLELIVFPLFKLANFKLF